MSTIRTSITFARTVILAFATIGGLSLAQAQTNEPIYQGCQQLAQLAASGWAEIERSERITCLNSNYIDSATYDQMIGKFLTDCTAMIEAKLGPRANEEGDHDIQLSQRELTLMFVQHYDPVFRQYCSTKNPSKVINTRPVGSVAN